MVAPAVEAPVVIGLDVGGTRTLSGIVDRDGIVRSEARLVGVGLVAFEALDGMR